MKALLDVSSIEQFLQECQTLLAVRLDPQGRMVFWNNAFQKLLAMDDSLSGRALEDFLLPETRTAFYAAREASRPWCKLGLVSLNNLVHTVQCRLFPDDEGLLLLAEKPVFTGADIFSQMSTLNDELVNLTRELKEKNALLEETTGKLQTLVTAAPMGVIVWDSSRHVRMWNPAAERIFGYRDEEVLGGPIPYSDPAMRKEVADLIDRAFAGERLENIELHRCHRDGSDLELVAALSPIHDSGGNVQEVIELIADVTDRREAQRRQRQWEQRMQEMQRLDSLSALAGGVAHDFNNLLMIISGNADLGMMDENLPPSAAELLHEIKGAATRAATLSNQMRAFSGSGHAAIEPLNLNKLIRSMESLLGAVVGHRITLDFDLAESLPDIRADHSQMDQLIVNLVTNAAEASPTQGGRIVVRTATEHLTSSTAPDHATGEELLPGPYVVLEVTDNGAGIANPEDIRKLFEPFYTTKFIGRGLGLAAVQGILRGHHGGMFVTSRPGEETTFRALLPQPTPTEEQQHSPHAELHPAGPGRLLLADDEEAVRLVAQRLLERLGFTVNAVASGTEALETLRQSPQAYSVAMLDWSMPGMEGAQTLQTLREIAPDLPILLCSGYGEANAKDLLKALPHAAFLEKPFALQSLVQALQDLLGKGSVG